ncbi:DUF1990 domain-containing protein [Kribbella sp. NPDC051137]|uniref:DUF1990 family protein n=1 Tax=Kribbella sp. NPDC051137 TaxID=3155045 RepID=UPI002F6A7704
MSTDLSRLALTDTAAGTTLTGDSWSFEQSVRLGSGEKCWTFVSAELLRWGVKTRSGFSVEGDPQVVAGRRFWVLAQVGPFRIREPVQVMAVVDEPRRAGFAYGTLAGHPVRGEETFLAERRTDDSVWLTVRSQTHPAAGLWRLAYPAALVAQRVYRRRYLAALLVEG